MKNFRSILLIAVLSLGVSLGIRVFLNHQENAGRHNLVTQACNLVSSQAQVGSLRDVYDQAFSVLRIYTKDPSTSLTLKDGDIEYGPRHEEGKNLETMPCVIEGNSDLLISFNFPKTTVFDNSFFILLASIFTVAISLRIISRWMLIRSIIFAHDEKYKNLIETIRRVRHDLRSPLAYLRNHGVTLIEQDSIASDTYNLSLNRVDVTLRELDKDINAQINLGKETTLQVAECLLLESIQTKKGLWGTKKNINLTFDFDKQNLSSIEIVPEHFVRSIENLLQNSFEAIENIGNIKVSCFRKHSQVCIDISDNGKGIPLSVLLQLGKSSVTFGKKIGNGIGLKMAKSWIEKWDGQFLIDSEEGRGTTVSITLPLLEVKAKFIAALPVSAKLNGYAIVDDEPEIAQSLVKETQGNGIVFDSITAYAKWLDEADDAHQKVHAFDLHLKHGSGLDLLQSIPWPERAVLYTNDYLNETAIMIAGELGVPIMPKTFL